ncbi:hypothetical protein [Capnocytophaga granulosa]|uniref:hypothetical protein n=1 Tax=Capnocytophaga granulosa TaxID=45242 RepID=UPI00205FA94D|nr:hypothetical protein [Capnocytophaga granulosa]DAY22105.1 MAG TPA: hypothetical protein [Caudoviricetes sp.]
MTKAIIILVLLLGLLNLLCLIIQREYAKAACTIVIAISLWIYFKDSEYEEDDDDPPLNTA